MLGARGSVPLRLVSLHRHHQQHQLRAKSATSLSAGVKSPKSLVQRIWQRYTRSLNEQPLLTKATFAATIFFCSDSATQFLLSPDPALVQWDAARALSGASFGIVATGWLHYWWGFLETFVARRVTTHRLGNTLTKVALDQAIGAPLYIYTYYVLTNFLQEVSASSRVKAATKPKAPWQQLWRETNSRAAEMLYPTMLQHWRVWIPVHSINFYAVPLHQRVMVQNVVLTFWSGYLSHLNNQNALMSPDEEIKATIVRRESERQMQADEMKQTSRKSAVRAVNDSQEKA